MYQLLPWFFRAVLRSRRTGSLGSTGLVRVCLHAHARAARGSARAYRGHRALFSLVHVANGPCRTEETRVSGYVDVRRTGSVNGGWTHSRSTPVGTGEDNGGGNGMEAGARTVVEEGV